MSTLFESRNQNKNKFNGSSVSLIRHFRNWRPDCNLDFRVAPRPRGWGHNHNPLVLQIGLLHRDLLRQKRKTIFENHWIKNWTLRFDEKKQEHFWKSLNIELRIEYWDMTKKRKKICENQRNLELNIGIWRKKICTSPSTTTMLVMTLFHSRLCRTYVHTDTLDQMIFAK